MRLVSTALSETRTTRCIRRKGFAVDETAVHIFVFPKYHIHLRFVDNTILHGQ